MSKVISNNIVDEIKVAFFNDLKKKVDGFIITERHEENICTMIISILNMKNGETIVIPA